MLFISYTKSIDVQKENTSTNDRSESVIQEPVDDYLEKQDGLKYLTDLGFDVTNLLPKKIDRNV